MKRRLRDHRLLNWPPVYQHKDGAISLKARIFTPLRYWIMENMVMLPLIKFWKVWIGLVIIDSVLVWMQVFTFFWLVPFTREDVLLTLGAAWVLYLIDEFSRNSLKKLLIGKTLRVRVNKDGVLRIGGRFWGRRYLLEHDLSFGTQMQQGSQESVFQYSSSINLIIGQVSRVDVEEVVDHNTAAMIVRSLNMMLRLAGGQRGGDVDYDPTRRIA